MKSFWEGRLRSKLAEWNRGPLWYCRHVVMTRGWKREGWHILEKKQEQLGSEMVVVGRRHHYRAEALGFTLREWQSSWQKLKLGEQADLG